MTSAALKALQCETDYLAGVDASLEAAKGKLLRGSVWERVRHDESDRLRALMAENRVYDRELLKSLPANRQIALHGFERRFLFGKRRTGAAVASVLTPLSHYAAGAAGEAPPIELGELIDHVHKLVGDRKVPHLLGICSPSGFTEEARAARLGWGNVTVVLVEPDGRGGWTTTSAGESADPRVLRLFDPEGQSQKVERVRKALGQRSADLLTGGVSLSSVVEEAKLPPAVVRQAFEQVARADPELRLTTEGPEMLLFRGAPAQVQEKKAMNVIERIRQLFSGEGNETEKINLLAERRATLAQRRDRIYEDIAKLEKKEAELLEQGKTTKSPVPRRRLAAQLAQLRKDIGRQNTAAAMLNQQINIISTDIHNLTLIQQGQMAKLPETAELTENAVKAEEMLETLKADSELVSSLESEMEEAVASEEELAILREFEDAVAERSELELAQPSDRQAVAESTEEPAAKEPPSAAPDAKDRSADAEPS
jgi:hypothetical protein